MTDPNGPTPPSHGGYNAAPPAPVGGAPASVPGKTLGIVALVVAFPACFLGMILGIVALVQSKKAGVKNGPALAAIIVGAVFTLIGIIAMIVVFTVVLPAALEMCNQLGPGVHEVNGASVTCS